MKKAEAPSQKRKRHLALKGVLVTAVLFSGFSATSCFKKKAPLSVLDGSRNPIQLQVGQRWAYREMTIHPGISQYYDDWRDTGIVFSNYEVAKDTVVNSLTWHIIAGMHYYVGCDSITPDTSRCAINCSDSVVRLLGFQDSHIWSTGPFYKRARSSESILDYDTTAFSALLFPIRFPLVEGHSWTYWSISDTTYAYPTIRTYMGQEQVEVPGGVFQAFKVKHEVAYIWGMFVSHLCYYDWYAEIGLVKRYVDYGPFTITDSVGQALGEIEDYTVAEYLGPEFVDPDTLKPHCQ